MTVAGIFEQIIDGFFAGFCGHQLTLAAKVAGGGKAVGAAQVAVVCNVQAHRLDWCGNHHVRKLLIIVGGEQLTVLVHLVNLFVPFLQLAACKACLQRCKQLCRISLLQLFGKAGVKRTCQKICIQQLNHIIDHAVHNMDCAAVDVHYNVVAV